MRSDGFNSEMDVDPSLSINADCGSSSKQYTTTGISIIPYQGKIINKIIEPSCPTKNSKNIANSVPTHKDIPSTNLPIIGKKNPIHYYPHSH